LEADGILAVVAADETFEMTEEAVHFAVEDGEAHLEDIEII